MTIKITSDKLENVCIADLQLPYLLSGNSSLDLFVLVGH